MEEGEEGEGGERRMKKEKSGEDGEGKERRIWGKRGSEYRRVGRESGGWKDCQEYNDL